MRLPLMMRDGSVPGAIDPGLRCRVLPCVCGPPVHHALEAAALGDAGDLHAVAFREDRDRDRGARGRRFAALGEREALDALRRRLHPGLLHVARQRLGRALRLPDAETELHPAGGHADDRAGAGLDHRHGDVRALGVEDPRHSQFASN
jgi:hypothetical protein